MRVSPCGVHGGTDRGGRSVQDIDSKGLSSPPLSFHLGPVASAETELALRGAMAGGHRQPNHPGEARHSRQVGAWGG